PPSSKIHPVFHSSLLKLHKGPLPLSTTLPPTAVDNKPVVEPLAFLDHKLDSSTDPPTPMVLVQWAGLPLEDTSWECLKSLQQIYHLEDKVRLSDGGDVSTTVTEAQSSNRPKRPINKPAHLKDFV
ncbi:hypothetical protein L195_g022213, partial [Trifolium pratense]